MSTEALNSCVRGELAAIETYRQALDKLRGEYSADARFQQLTAMLRDHEEAAAQLQAAVRQSGGTPDDSSGAWGTWSKTVMGAAKLFGDAAALKALKEGEEDGRKQYETLSQSSDAPGETRALATTLMARNQRHIRELDVLIERA